MFYICVLLRFFQQQISNFLYSKNNYTNSLKKSFYSTPSTINNKISLSRQLSSTNLFNRIFVTTTFNSNYNYNSRLNNNVLYYLLTNYTSYTNFNSNLFYSLIKSIRLTLINLLNVFKTTIGDGFLYLRGIFIICFIDACLTDDEPI